MSIQNAAQRRLTTGTALRFWLPLEATWLMMAFEGPFLAAVIARLADPTSNLAAFGVSSSLAWIVEAPIVMMLSASNALVRDKIAFLRLRRFSTLMNGAVTAVMLILLLPPVFDLVARRLMGLPPEIARLSGQTMLFLVLWPAAIGYRRFYQGILIRQGKPRAVAYGTVIRISTMGLTGVVLALLCRWPVSIVGGGALGIGVLAEAAASRFMARRSIRNLRSQSDEDCEFGRSLTRREIGRFYAPLALTSVLSFSVHPLTSFFLARSRMPIESLAVMPVVMGLVFLFRTGGIAAQEVVIALHGDGTGNTRFLRRFTGMIGLFGMAGMTAVIFSPLAPVWLRTLSGLSPELAEFALWPGRLLILLPLLEAVLGYQRGILVRARKTDPIMAGVVAQIGVIVGVFWLTVGPLGLIGAMAAGIAQTAGYLAGNGTLSVLAKRGRVV
jgi:progressive ankylosis protein